MFGHLRSENVLYAITKLQSILHSIRKISSVAGVFEIAVEPSKEIDNAVRYVPYRFLRKLKESPQQQAIHAPRCRSTKLTPITCDEQDTRRGVMVSVFCVWRWSHEYADCQKDSLTAIGSHRCWRGRWYSCWTCNSDSSLYAWHVHQVSWFVFDIESKEQTYKHDGYSLKSSKGSKNQRCVKWWTTQYIWTWCEGRTGSGRREILHCCSSRQPDVPQTDDGGIQNIARSRETVLLGLNYSFRQDCRSAPGSCGGESHGICRSGSHRPTITYPNRWKPWRFKPWK